MLGLSAFNQLYWKSKISYIYDASGNKLAVNANGSLTYYRSVMVYGHDNKLLYMLHPEGTVSRTEGSAGMSYTYNYFKTDHLGSTRVMLTAVDGVLQASQTTDYYPFGLSFENNNLNKNKYLFSGKEFQDGQLGGSILGWYDFGARFYDPVLGRWFNVDPVARFANPYLYCVNNPVMSIDPDGRNPVVIIVALLVAGGTINVVANWDNIENFWQGLGFFATGAGSAALAIWGGPAGLIGGGFLNGSGNAALSGADGADVLKQGIISAGVAGASAPVGYAFSKASNWTFNGLKNGSLLKQIAVQTTTGYATGVSMAYLVQGISTGEWGEETWSYAANAGWKSAVNANITGLGFRFYKANVENKDFMTLKPKGDKVTVIGESMKRVNKAAAEIPGAKTLNDMPEFKGQPYQIESKMMEYNRKWILEQMRGPNTIYDIGPDPMRARPSMFYQMEQRMLQNYDKLHPDSPKPVIRK